MPVALLKAALSSARDAEQHTRALERKLTRVLADLHPSIRLPAADRLNTLMAFAHEYIAHVPRLAQALTMAARDASQEHLVEPLLARIHASYGRPTTGGMVSMLDRAYYVQRLVEEVNDRFMAQTGAPLLTLDMTTANLIVHALIGEPYANQLDTEAAGTAEHILSLHPEAIPRVSSLAVQEHRFRQWTTAWRHWSEELGVESISLRFEQSSPTRQGSLNS